ncbi:unnamed protein product [Candida verbasci]|uniref:Mitochondrial thiamine pyrophosphate carrier 1 n=1 Tax=Candida verbasci TaxID=1227364 RepID=A0A9W4XH55_9ASCO|nr:unnamed protein product [Candida verbasci]
MGNDDIRHELHPFKEISIGAISGMIGKLVEFPFDTIKVRLQSNHHPPISTFQMIKQTFTQEGVINGFYKGLKAPLVGACLETSILFTCYNFSNVYLTKSFHLSDDNFAVKCLSGAFAGFAASFILTPIELVKCQLQVSNLVTRTGSTNIHTYSTIIMKILNEKGIIGLFHGLESTIVREVFGTSIWFGTYEYINQYYRNTKDTYIKNESLRLLISGAMAGLTFNLSVFPIDTIKSNIQTFDLRNHGKPKLNSWQITKYILSKPGGFKNLYNGLGITLIRSIPANAIIFYSYEVLKQNI